MPSPLMPLLRQHYPDIAKDLLSPMLDTLNIGRAICGGDLDKLLIILVVALRTAEDRRALDIDPEGVLKVHPSLSTNVRSIAESTGIPKESVRRKVTALVEEGWIRRVDHSLSLAPHASRMLTDFREQVFHLALRHHQTVAALEQELDQGR
ncbi:helix-turn-helix domain-containing protein [Phenylobacterium sp. LjRoot225]|uniref:helix-turn-helix domain-containing protein n=1 Tax=Phenylobacterium sp. LjRoot225 TaxID=3342285 RepID=UPI003ECED19C